MPRRIDRAEFVDARRNQRLDLNAAKADPTFRAKVEAAGLKVEDLDRLDLYTHDGFLDGPRELGALFDLLRGLQRGGPADALVVNDLGWSATPVDKAVEALEPHFSPLPAPVRRTWPPVSAAGQQRLFLSAAVGAGAPNRPDDVRAVQQRLRAAGMEVSVDGQYGPRTEHAIRTYRSMLTGADEVKDELGRVEPNDIMHHALASEAPPRWERMPREGVGFVNEDYDGFGWGSAETTKAIEEMGAAFERDYRSANPGVARLSINDVSERHGGNNRDHETHENGLDLDLRLPRRGGGSGSDVRWANYDREAAWGMMKAMAENPRVERVIFSDARLLERAKNEPWGYKVFDGGAVHRNHFHVDIKPPTVTPQ